MTRVWLTRLYRLGDVINTWRESLDLEAIAFSEGPLLAEKLKIPTTYCWSPALVPKPEDWGSHIGAKTSTQKHPAHVFRRTDA